MENESAMPGMLMAAASGLMSYGMAGGKFGKGAKVPGADTGINTSMDLAWDPSGNLSNSQMLQGAYNMDASAFSGLDISGANSFGINQTVLRNPGFNPSLNYSMGLGPNINMDLFGNTTPWWKRGRRK